MSREHPRVPAPALFAFLVLRDAVARFQRHRCTTAAAAIAFHVLFSLFPLILIVAALIGSDIRDEGVRSQISDGLMAALPLDETAKAQIDRLLERATR
ncbi:MAG: YhjD/YihY/BrkB family envelope integrity protein, partial [Actinomycetota bacterium]